MTRSPLSIPFGVGLLCLLAIILVPLVGALLVIGWFATAQLEEAVLAARIRALESTLSTLTELGFRRFGDAQQTLADSGLYDDSAAATAGSHGRGPIGEAVLGSVSKALVRTAPCAVLVAGKEVEARFEPAGA